MPICAAPGGVFQLTEISDDALTRPVGGAIRLHQRPVSELLAVRFFVAWSDEHAGIVKQKIHLGSVFALVATYIVAKLFFTTSTLEKKRGDPWRLETDWGRKSVKIDRSRQNGQENILKKFLRAGGDCRTWVSVSFFPLKGIKRFSLTRRFSRWQYLFACRLFRHLSWH